MNLGMGHEIDRLVFRVPQRPQRTRLGGILFAVAGPLLGPLYWILATCRGAPGMRFRLRCFGWGLRALLGGKHRLPLSVIFHLLFMPMESTRYFELDFAWRSTAPVPARRCLDVSSPRMFPLGLILHRPELASDLINPNIADLKETRRMLEALAASRRWQLHDCLVADAPFPPGSFDLVTSLSVVEHIPDDIAAIRRMWELVAPGGRLVLTLPCMARAAEQYLDRDEWGLLQKDGEGLVFWQRFYDEELLQRNVYAITGEPRHCEVYGEKVKGTLHRNSEQKRGEPYYPYWREPYMMATGYRHFERVADLSGEGVIGLVFVKA
jgi:hypothetical protein